MSYAEAQYTIDEITNVVKAASIPPRAISSLSAIYNRTSGIVTLSFESSSAVYIDTFASDDPTETTPSRSKVVETAELEIWRRDNSEITKYGQGTKLATISSTSSTYNDDVSSISEDTDFYYAVFAVSDFGVVNKNSFVTTTVDNYNVIHNVYGFKQNFADLDPSTTITYPSIVEDPDNRNVTYRLINAEYTPMSITASTDDFIIYTSDPGSYGNFLTNVLKNKPYMVKASDRKADYQLSETKYSKKSDNTTNSDFSNSSYSGGPFAWVNKIYTKEIYNTDGNNSYRIVLFSNSPDVKNAGFKPTGFVNPSNQELEGVWIPMGYTDSNGKLYGGTTGATSTTTTQEKTNIEKLTSEAKFFGGPILNVLRDVAYMLFKSTNIQATAGYGRCSGYGSTYPSVLKSKYAIPNQVMDESIGFSGNGSNPSLTVLRTSSGSRGFAGCTDSTNKALPAKMFHSQVLGSYNISIRDPYTLSVNGRIKVSPNYTYDITGDSYVDTGKVYTAKKSVYPVKLFHTEAGSLPDLDDASGSSSTGATCDLFSVDVSGVRVARLFGDSFNDLYDGPSRINLLADASYSDSDTGCATLLLPPVGYSPEA